MDNIFSQIIPLTAAMALPFPVIKAIRLLLAGRPVAHSTLFIVIWGIVCFLALSLAVIFKKILLGFFGIVTTYSPPAGFSGWMHIVLGLVFISIGVKKLKSGMEQRDTPPPQSSIELTSSAIIKAAVKIELFNLKNGLLLFFIFYILLKGQIGFERSIIASGLIAITAMIWVSMPLLVYFWTGRKRDIVLEKLKEWLVRNNAALVIFIYIFLGISALSSGIGELIPELLEKLFEVAT